MLTKSDGQVPGFFGKIVDDDVFLIATRALLCSGHTNSSSRVLLEWSHGLPEPYRATLGPRGAPWGDPPPPPAIIPIHPAKATIGYASGCTLLLPSYCPLCGMPPCGMLSEHPPNKMAPSVQAYCSGYRAATAKQRLQIGTRQG